MAPKSVQTEQMPSGDPKHAAIQADLQKRLAKLLADIPERKVAAG